MSKVLSIEIGYSLIKIMETDYKVKSPKVYKSINLDTPQDVIQDGELKVTEALVSYIKQALVAHAIKTKQVVFTITSTKIASREVVLPNVKENKISTVIRANASDYFPVDISQYEIEYIPLGLVGEETDNVQRKVLVLAAPHSILDGYEQLAKALGLSLAALDYSCNSIYQVVKNECKEGIEMVIKVDEQVSIITILENGQILLQRSVSYGVDEAVHTMMETEAWGILNYQQALELLRRKTCVNRVLNAQLDIAEQDAFSSEVESEQIRIAKQRITESLEGLMRGIARVIDFYNSRNAGKQITKIFLTGLGGDFSGLSKLLTNELGFHVVVLNKVEGFNIEKNFREASFGEYIACLGAAIAPLGFMHEKEKDKKGAKSGFHLSTLTAVSVLILCLIITIVMLVLAYLPLRTAQNDNRTYRMQIEELSNSIPSYLEYTATKQAYEYLINAYGNTQLVTADLVNFIEEMEQKMPHAFFIDSFTAGSTGFSMNVTVNTKKEAAECIEQLRTFASILSLNVNGIYDSRNVLTDLSDDSDEELADVVNEAMGNDVIATDSSVVTFSVSGTFSGLTSSETDMESQSDSGGIQAENGLTNQSGEGAQTSEDDELEADIESVYDN